VGKPQQIVLRNTEPFDRHDLGNLDVQLGEAVPGEIASSWEVAAGGSTGNVPAGLEFFPPTQHARRGRLVGECACAMLLVVSDHP
jgi:hypothetical protein